MAVNAVVTPLPTTEADPNLALSRRELVVLSTLEEGLTLDEIAGRLFVSRNTIKTQVRSLYRKLGVSSRAEAVAVLRLRRQEPVVPRRPTVAPADVRLADAAHGAADAGAPESDHRARHGMAVPDVDPPAGAVPTGSSGCDAVPSQQHAVEPVTSARLARLARKREETRKLLDALDGAIAAEVAAERSRGISWTELAAALGTSRQATRRQFEDG
jgi:DNA-binding CsgD family transcriptional regulator